MTKFFAHKHIISRAAALLLTTALLSSCGNGEPQNMQPPPSEVDFMEVSPGSALMEQKYPGTIEGAVNVEVKAQVSGYLEAIYVREGDYVQKGQALFRIKGDVYREQVNNSQAALQAALAAEESARIEVEKIKPLVEGKVVADVQLKTAQANYAAARAQVAQARAAVGSSQINADFSLIKAPVSGYIGRIPNRIGNLVTPADMTPLTTLSEINKVFVYFNLSEPAFLAWMKKKETTTGMNTVEMVMADGTPYQLKGKLEAASGNIDRTTGSIAMKAVFDNPNKLLRSGGSAKIVLKKSLNSTLLVPMASVKDIQNKYFVFVLADSNKVAMTPIEIAGHDGNNYILSSGLNNGAKIAINRIDVLNDGTVVKPVIVPADSILHQ